MSDDKPTTPPEETPAPEEKAPETEKKPLSDEEKALLENTIKKREQRSRFLRPMRRQWMTLMHGRSTRRCLALSSQPIATPEMSR